MGNVFRKGSIDARVAKAFLHDILWTAGLRNVNQRENGDAGWGSGYAPAADKVCKAVINSSFTDVDAEIKQLTTHSFIDSLTNANAKAMWYSEDEIAIALVYLAECLSVYWDDLSATPYEKAAFSKTLLGKYVGQYGRFTSMIPAATVTTSSIPTSNPAAGTKKTSTRTPGQPPKNGYKSSGAQSGNVRDLIGAPGNKLTASGNTIYKITGTNSKSKNTAFVFIKPLEASGALNGTNRIFIGSANGYTDCVCQFDDINDAQNFLNEILTKANIPQNITNLHIKDSKADKNGYYLVGTVYGPCAISASKLNEALEEQIELEDFDTEHTSWDKTFEGNTELTKEELHYYMRKG